MAAVTICSDFGAPQNVHNLISCSSAYSKSNLDIWKFTIKLLESQFLGRLVRRPGSPRRRKGPRALKVEIRVWNSQGGKDKHYFLHSFSSVQFSHSAVSDSLWPYESQHARPPCPSPTPSVHANSCVSSQWYHPAISSSVVPFSSCPQSLPASGSFPMSQLFAWGGQTIGVSASGSVLPMNTQDWSPLGSGSTHKIVK